MNIFVSSLSYGTTDGDLKQLFESYGNVSSAKVIMDKDTNRSKGFGFVEMPNDEEGNKAIKELDSSRFDGRSISVSVARPRAENTGGNRRSFAGSRW
jgi:RNA recognition motif-containing protein